MELLETMQSVQIKPSDAASQVHKIQESNSYGQRSFLLVSVSFQLVSVRPSQLVSKLCTF